MSLDAMKQALAALENSQSYVEFDWVKNQCGRAITTLRAAIEQAQEPVAWQVMVEDEAMKEFPIKDMAHDWCAKKKLSGSPSAYWIRPLYTAPRQWQGLTDEDVDEVERWIEFKEDGSGRIPNQKLVRYIEAKLKAKNT